MKYSNSFLVWQSLCYCHVFFDCRFFCFRSFCILRVTKCSHLNVPSNCIYCSSKMDEKHTGKCERTKPDIVHIICVHKYSYNQCGHRTYRRKSCANKHNAILLPHHEGRYKLNAKQGEELCTTNSMKAEKIIIRRSSSRRKNWTAHTCLCITKTDWKVLPYRLYKFEQ